MYRKQNTLLVVSLVGLLLLTAFFYGYQQRDNFIDKNLFKVDPSVVNRIVLSSKSRAIEISKEESRWKVNGKLADENMVEVLLATLAQAEPRRPVSKLRRDSISSVLSESGVQVTLISGDDEVQSFYAGGNLQKTEAYFLKQGEGTPYAMVIPGYRVYVSGIFEVDEMGWLDRRIFNFNWRNFKSLKADFASPTDGFEVTLDGKIFSIAGLATDTAKLNTFLDQVSLLEADRFIPNEPLRDSLSALQPEISFHVATFSGEVYSLSIYRQTGLGTVYGLTASNPVAVFDHRKLSPILQRKQWFELK